MVPTVKYTTHYILKIENIDKAKNVLDLYLRNRLAFEQYEPTRPSDFYSIDYHHAMLNREYHMYLLGNFVRYYIYSPTSSTRIIGAINFNFFRNGNQAYAEIGYKVDTLYQNQGVAYETVSAAIATISEHYGIQRFDARIHPNNTPSIKLATKLGFLPVRLEPQSANIMGKYEDLIRYSLNISHIQ